MNKIPLNRNVRENIAGWLFSLPVIIVIFTFLVLPFLTAISHSFTNRIMLMGPKFELRWIGLQNYTRLLADKDFIQSIYNNLRFAVVVVPLQSSLALALALLINREGGHVRFFRALYFSPVVIPMVVVSIIWAFILLPGEEGLMNAILSKVSFGLIEPLNWLKASETAMESIMLFSIWQGVGFQMVIFLAGLQTIPYELYEAAQIDGAGAVRRLFNVTIPQLKNTITFVIISTTIFAFKLFSQVFVLTNGGPKGATATMVYQLYKEGYIDQKVGYSASIAVMFFIIVLMISLIQRIFLKQQEA